MKIKIRESELRKIIKEAIIKESYGVPDGIYETADLLLNELIKQLDENPNGEIGVFKEFLFNGDFNILDFKFNDIAINIAINYESNRNDKFLNYGGASNKDTHIQAPKFRILASSYSIKNNNVTIRFGVSDKIVVIYSHISYMLKNNKIHFKSILVHELKHIYDGLKKPMKKAMVKAEYDSYAKYQNSPIKPLNNFIYGLYYNHDFESMVRNSEFYTLLKDNNIKKSNFNEFLENSAIYKQLKSYKYLTIDNIIKDLKNNYMIDIDKILINFQKYLDSDTVDNKILKIFEIIFINLRDNKLNALSRYLSNTNPSINGLSGRNKDYYDSEVNNLNKIDIMSFFRNKQIEMNNNADLAMKKISQLFLKLEESNLIVGYYDGPIMEYGRPIITSEITPIILK